MDGHLPVIERDHGDHRPVRIQLQALVPGLLAPRAAEIFGIPAHRPGTQLFENHHEIGLRRGPLQ